VLRNEEEVDGFMNVVMYIGHTVCDGPYFKNTTCDGWDNDGGWPQVHRRVSIGYADRKAMDC